MILWVVCYTIIDYLIIINNSNLFFKGGSNMDTSKNKNTFNQMEKLRNKAFSLIQNNILNENPGTEKIDDNNLTASGGHVFETEIKDAEKYGLKRKKKIFKKDKYIDTRDNGKSYSKEDAEMLIKIRKSKEEHPKEWQEYIDMFNNIE